MGTKTIAITGVSGYFGRILLPLLEAEEAPEGGRIHSHSIGTILGFDRIPLQRANAHPGEPNRKRFGRLIFKQLDTTSPEFEPMLQGCDTVVHLAFQVMRLPHTRDLERINRQGVRFICEAAARQGVRKLVITSSVVAYGMHADNPPLLTEDSPLRPNPGLYYGTAKADNEHFFDAFTQQHPEMIITRLRPCTVVGPQADPRLMASLTSDPTPLVWGCDPPIQLVHEDDMARALYLAITRDLPGVYNVVSDEPQTLSALVRLRGGRTVNLPYAAIKALMSVAWRLGRSTFAPEWVDLSRYTLVASNARLKAAGWEPQYTTAQAFRALIAPRSSRDAQGQADPGVKA